MTKRYAEPVEVHTDDPVEGEDGVAPCGFTWRGGRYRVLAVLGHWREDASYWTGGGVAVPQRDLWRVEADRARAAARGHHGPEGGSSARRGLSEIPTKGIYELVAEGGTWRLDRVWD